MDQSSEIFVGIDVSKARNAIAIAEGGRDGEVRYLGEVEASGANLAGTNTRRVRSALKAAFAGEVSKDAVSRTVAIIAIMRKLVILANVLLRDDRQWGKNAPCI